MVPVLIRVADIVLPPTGHPAKVTPWDNAMVPALVITGPSI